MSMSKRELRAINTKNKLLTVSKELIINNGYENVSISNICKTCNVAKGTFYTYFKSKDDIIISILKDINEAMFSNLKFDETNTSVENLSRYQTFYLDNVVRGQGKRVTREIFRIICDHKFKDHDFYSCKHSEYLEKTIRQGQEEGVFRKDLDAGTLSGMMQSLNFGIMINWSCHDDAESIEEQGIRVLEMFINYLKLPAGSF